MHIKSSAICRHSIRRSISSTKNIGQLAAVLSILLVNETFFTTRAAVWRPNLQTGSVHLTRRLPNLHDLAKRRPSWIKVLPKLANGGDASEEAVKFTCSAMGPSWVHARLSLFVFVRLTQQKSFWRELLCTTAIMLPCFIGIVRRAREQPPRVRNGWRIETTFLGNRDP